MVKKERKKTAIAYICLSVALLISTLLGISFAWFTDTATGNGSAQFGTIDLGTVTASTKTNVMPGDTIGGSTAETSLGSFTYSANAESAYWRATYEITDNVSTELENFVIEPEFGAITSSATEQTITLTRTITVPTSLTNAYQEQTITIKITIDAIQQANLPAEASTPQTAFAYMDANNLDYVTGEAKVVAQTYAITKNTPANGTVTLDKTTVTIGGSVVITITPNSGYEIDTLIINGVAVASANIINNTYTLTNVTSAKNIVVSFAAARNYTQGLAMNGTTLTGIGTATLTNGVLIVPREVTEIADSAFKYDTEVIFIGFEDKSSCTRIGECAFADTTLQGIDLPASLLYIGNGAFKGCSKLSQASFTVKYAWWVTKDPTTGLAGATLLNSLESETTNATYLTETYVNYVWIWGD